MKMKAVDLHCDTLMALNKARLSGIEKTFGENDLHVDLGKLKKGDYLLQCFAAFTDARNSHSYPLMEALQEIDVFHQIMKEHVHDMAPVYRFSDIERNREEGKISALLSIEDGGITEGDLSVLRMVHRLGVRMITLTWNYENPIGYPATNFGKEESGSSKGLKEQGIAFLSEMERLGIMVDVSHLSDEGFYDVARYAGKPFLASHSDARSLCSHPRNLTDDMLKVLAEKGGLVGMNYYFGFLDEDRDRLQGRGTAETVVDHIEHVRNVAGIDVIALGSDFDGIEETLDLEDASKMHLLVAALERRGFRTGEIEKIFSLNALRFFRELL
ncbi:dipeptidase [Proteiniclasticum sp. C24MP]|uniref:dipeptidase n=1 Tax=Proteiniclasticum sp. C24MP TaxID=3374101 RepID=UPI003754BD4E